jgi:alpha-L-fucosidase
MDDIEIQPDKHQQSFMDLKFGLFIHFGINTFYNTEISEGELPLFSFDPPEVDTDQWCLTAKNCGMKYIVYSAKAMDGFCSWPSRYSNYTVEFTPYKADILDRLVNSANKYGLKVGLSYSLWDKHVIEGRPSDQVYLEFILNQLEELLSNYGNLAEIWFDGFWIRQQNGWKGEDGFATDRQKFIHSWRREGAFRWQWDHLYRFVKSLQPACLVFNNSTRVFKGLPLHPVDGRNAEKGQNMENDQPVWDWLGEPVYLPLQIETTLSMKGKGKFLDGNWYYHQGDRSIAKRWQVNSWRRKAEKINANLLLNVGPTPGGRLRPEDEKLLLKIRK